MNFWKKRRHLGDLLATLALDGQVRRSDLQGKHEPLRLRRALGFSIMTRSLAPSGAGTILRALSSTLSIDRPPAHRWIRKPVVMAVTSGAERRPSAQAHRDVLSLRSPASPYTPLLIHDEAYTRSTWVRDDRGVG